MTTAPPGYDGPVPYGFGIVELDGDLRIITRITETEPTTLSFGQAVELVPDEIGTTETGERLITWAFAPSLTRREEQP